MRPRSSATTFMPPSVSSFAKMPPVQPRPTITTSVSLSLVAMSIPPSAHVRDRQWIVVELLVAVIDDVLLIHLDDPWEADHLPSGLVAVAPVDRVGERALHDSLV